MNPGDLATASLRKSWVYIIHGVDVDAVKIAAVVITSKPSCLITLDNGTVTNLFKTEFFASYRDAKRKIIKNIDRIERRLRLKIN